MILSNKSYESEDCDMILLIFSLVRVRIHQGNEYIYGSIMLPLLLHFEMLGDFGNKLKETVVYVSKG